MSSCHNQQTVAELIITDKVKMDSGRPVIGGTLSFPKVTLSTLTSAATVTYSASQVLGGLIKDTISEACAAKVPAPADIVAAIPGCVVGTSFEFDVLNTAASGIAITITANGSSTVVGTASINQANNKRIRAVVTSVTNGAESVVFYMLGSSAT
jgi:hypothetical protein